MQNNSLSTAELQMMVEKNRYLKSSKHLKVLLSTQNSLREKKSKKISFEESFIKFKNAPVIFPNTINIIQGQKGQHKSRLAEYFISVLLGEKELIGFHTKTNDDYVVCLVDTERNLKEQLPYALQSILKKAGYKYNDNPEKFLYTSLLNVKRASRFEALKEFINYSRKTADAAGKNLFVVLDVITDFINNFNDPSESLKLVDMINDEINSSNVTFLLVIHENPAQTVFKARGHLGTELTNKASTVIKVSIDKNYDNSPVRVEFIHNRLTKKLDDIYLDYSDEIKGFVLAENIQRIIQPVKKITIDVIIEDLKERFEVSDSINKKEFIEETAKKHNITERTIYEKIRRIREHSIIILNGNKYHLTEMKDGRQNFLSLSEIF
jgi:hypothetical protein